MALWVAGLPGAVGHMRAFGTGPLLLGTAGLLLLCLLRTPVRWIGAALVALSTFWAVATPLPDVLVAGDGRAAAVRGADGRLAVLENGRDTFAIKEWLMADADGARPTRSACMTACAAMRSAASAVSPTGGSRRWCSIVEAFAEDCARAAVVVSGREAPGECAATLIDRRTWRAHGATGAALDRQSLREILRAAARLRPAQGGRDVAAPGEGGAGHSTAARCDAAGRGSRAGRLAQ